MKKYGWFEYDDSPRSITNSLTGQRFVVSGQYSEGDSDFYTCEYCDSELSFPFRFAIHRHPRRGNLIELDYVDQFANPPQYGIWRRLDDFLTDALLSWPDFVFSSSRFFLLVTGGWRSGVWQPGLKRLFWGEKSVAPGAEGNSVLAEPYVTPLDLPAPKAWNYVDNPFPASNAELKVRLLEPWNVPYVDSQSPLQGFQELVPYLVQEDGQAFIFPSKVALRLDRDGDVQSVDLYYTYADEHLFFTHRSSTWGGLELWSCTDYGFRQFPPDRDYWATTPMGNLVAADTLRPKENCLSQFAYLSYTIWRKTVSATGDAWPSWPVPGRRIELSSCGESVQVGQHGPDIYMGYTAGFVNTSFWLQYRDA